jgi:hypothetical protein
LGEVTFGQVMRGYLDDDDRWIGQEVWSVNFEALANGMVFPCFLTSLLTVRIAEMKAFVARMLFVYFPFAVAPMCYLAFEWCLSRPDSADWAFDHEDLDLNYVVLAETFSKRQYGKIQNCLMWEVEISPAAVSLLEISLLVVELVGRRFYGLGARTADDCLDFVV